MCVRDSRPNRWSDRHQTWWEARRASRTKPRPIADDVTKPEVTSRDLCPGCEIFFPTILWVEPELAHSCLNWKLASKERVVSSSAYARIALSVLLVEYVVFCVVQRMNCRYPKTRDVASVFFSSFLFPSLSQRTLCLVVS